MKAARGQASSEYLVILAFCVMALVLTVLGPSPVLELVQAIKDYFSAYSYVISVTPQNL